MTNSSMAFWAVSVNRNKEIVAVYNTDGESKQNSISRVLSGEFHAIWRSSKGPLPFVKDNNWANSDGELIEIIFRIGR